MNPASDGTWDAVLAAPFGRIGLRLQGGRLWALDLMGGGPLLPPSSPAARRMAMQLEAYLSDPGSPLAVAVAERGTPFQRRVWEALRAIPCGATRSYGELARELGTSPRAVGGACRANPTPLVVPCHRVVGGAGLGGFAGATAGADVERKRWLLVHEGAWLQDG